jgi:glycosyltransferase involved in cell wall biosynthesis
MAKQAKVLHVISGLAIGEKLGGAELAAVELACHLDRAKFEPIVCAVWHSQLPAEQYWLDYLKQHKVHVLFAADGTRNFRALEFTRGIQSILAQLQGERIDIVHSHFQVGNIAAMLLRRRLRPVVMVRSAQAGREWGDSALALLSRQVFTKWIFPFAFDAETGVTSDIVRTLDRRPGAILGKKKAYLIHNAYRFDPKQAQPLSRHELGLQASDLVVGAVGRLRAEKGHTILIDAVPAVVQQVPNARFILAGDGELRGQLECKVVDMGLSDVVKFLGFRRDVDQLLKTMDLFVLPSFWEGFSLAALESMACGTPVIGTDIPGTRELVQHGVTGWLAKPNDPDSLATCMIEALSAPAKRAEIARAAYDAVAVPFSMDSIAKCYENLYEALLTTHVASCGA